MSPSTVQTILHALDSTDAREILAQRAVDIVRKERGYRWVGIYDVGDDEISLLAYSGPSAPTHRQFPIDQGLSGEAVRLREPVVSNDVAHDPRYLEAFSSTGSEAIVPILGAESGIAIGTIDVESENTGAFTADDVKFLEDCAVPLIRLFE